MRLHAPATVSVLVACLAPGAAKADGPAGDVVGQGVSRGGQSWTQTASVFQGRLNVDISLPDRSGTDNGGGSSGPISPRNLLVLDRGEGFGTHADEYLLDGWTYRSVRTLRVTTTRGQSTFRVREAPADALARTPALARVRFFVRFFERGHRPLRVDALDARGHLLQRARLGRPG